MPKADIGLVQSEEVFGPAARSGASAKLRPAMTA